MERVIDVRTREKARADQVLADTRRALHIAQKATERAKAAAVDAAKHAADLQKDQKELEGLLVAAKLKAERDTFTNKLEDNLRAQRLLNDAVLSANDVQVEKEQAEADLGAALDAAQKAASQAAAAYED